MADAWPGRRPRPARLLQIRQFRRRERCSGDGVGFHLHHIILPLAISFFTFQKIAYLVDSSRGVVKGTGPVEFGLFASFFPQLLAGPIVHYSEIIPQLRTSQFTRLLTRNLVIGLVIFAIGLAKKTIIADSLASYANPLFTDVQSQPWDFTRGWTAAITYMLQLYTDFSGYSDMAIGLGRMFGVKLPLNFHSPLRAASIIDYWRRWHMTLQRFLLAYVYQPIALPMNRWALARGLTGWSAFIACVAVPTLFTFLLSGLWHGAGWTFIMFGLMHAIYVLVNEIWRERRKQANRTRRKAKLPPVVVGRWDMIFYHTLTLFALGFTNVMFRAASLGDAWTISRAMLGLDGWGTGLAESALPPVLAVMLVAAIVIVAVFPNTQQIMAAYRPAVNFGQWRDVNHPPLMWRWRPNTAGIVFAGVVLFAGIMFIQRGAAVFLYFNF
ncbi:MBOAT family O-acyltransferase [Glacieibacterium megasporae]|uniref:MBOAT family O-acyltransferase n=1 Tax=Glacieibacterium megasporae TaxID=2835787 RepID=UPI001C1E745F|nr:MBOAT family O-acyltransferase [Polymorphobacter megasporae]UAJ11547.1 MBOAT family protein [Polymorphobacter megasporae]